MVEKANTTEILHTYTYIIEKARGEIIKNLILSREGISSWECAWAASDILERSRLFSGIRLVRRPIALKKLLDKFIPQDEETIALKEKNSYRLDTYP